jgi:hypothetical protein
MPCTRWRHADEHRRRAPARHGARSRLRECARQDRGESRARRPRSHAHARRATRPRPRARSPRSHAHARNATASRREHTVASPASPPRRRLDDGWHRRRTVARNGVGSGFDVEPEFARVPVSGSSNRNSEGLRFGDRCRLGKPNGGRFGLDVDAQNASARCEVRSVDARSAEVPAREATASRESRRQARTAISRARLRSRGSGAAPRRRRGWP